MFNNKRIAELERKVKSLEEVVRRTHDYLQQASEPRIVEFIPDPAMSADMRRKMN